MTVRELIEQLASMPQDVDVRMIAYDDCTYTVKHCYPIEFKGQQFVQLDNYDEDE